MFVLRNNRTGLLLREGPAFQDSLFQMQWLCHNLLEAKRIRFKDEAHCVAQWFQNVYREEFVVEPALVNGMVEETELCFLVRKDDGKYLGYDDWGDYRWLPKKDAARMTKRRAEELQIYFMRLGDKCQLERFKDDTPEWARKDPNICPCGIHRAQCDYHR